MEKFLATHRVLTIVKVSVALSHSKSHLVLWEDNWVTENHWKDKVHVPLNKEKDSKGLTIKDHYALCISLLQDRISQKSSVTIPMNNIFT